MGGSVHPCTDLANARRFAAEHGADVRYSHREGAWYCWDGRRWRRDDTGEAERKAKATVSRLFNQAAAALKRAAAAGGGDQEKKFLSWAIASQQAKRVQALLALARSEPGLAVLPDQFDADPWLLNCPNGTVDLRTGVLRDHSRGDLLTALCPTPHDPAAPCPAWEAFLGSVFAGDAELVAFVRRLLGYCLTGDTSVHVLPVFWGEGRNGKSTLLEAVMGAVGADYADKAESDLLLAKRGETHPTGKADLKGKRLAVATETAEGRKLDEATVKELTGGDTIKARRMRENFWSFRPTHKLILCTNHKPRVKEGGHATWARLRLVPFGVRFWDPDRGEAGPPELRADHTMPDRLRGEAAGVLAWMVRGCGEWLNAGRALTMPRSVATATREYQAEEDLVAQFLAERCVREAGASVRPKLLYPAYAEWCKVGDERPVSRKAFGGKLREAAGVEVRKSNGTVYAGIRLRRDGEDERQEEEVGGAGADRSGPIRTDGPPISGYTPRGEVSGRANPEFGSDRSTPVHIGPPDDFPSLVSEDDPGPAGEHWPDDADDPLAALRR